MTYERTARDTLTAIELDVGEEIAFTLDDGTTPSLEVLDTRAEIMFTTLDAANRPLEPERGARTFYEFECDLAVNGETHTLRREVPTNESFYEPWVIDGVEIWFDAVADIFDYLTESHGAAQGCPNGDARFAIQDATKRICPEPIHPWCPLPREMDIYRCYLGEDCWLGTYFGADAHVGLDINHPSPTAIWAPIDFDDHYLFDRVDGDANNNRHRGHHHWEDGSEWQLQCHHMTDILIDEHEPIAAGEQYADGAGVLNGYHEHSHFVFRVVEPDGTEILLDPWILFRQMYLDIENGLVPEQFE